MERDLILASASATRQKLLLQAAIPFRSVVPRIDEDAAKQALLAEGASPRDIADTLAEMKARKVSEKFPTAFVLGCDQTLSLDGTLFSKPTSPADAAKQLQALQGQTHHLHTALVIYENARPVWRCLATSRMTMRALSEAWIASYVDRNWQDIAHSVGGYLIESEGISLFSAVEGEHTAIMGLPLPLLIGYLASRGFIAS
jgi:septum formation protein